MLFIVSGFTGSKGMLGWFPKGSLSIQVLTITVRSVKLANRRPFVLFSHLKFSLIGVYISWTSTMLFYKAHLKERFLWNKHQALRIYLILHMLVICVRLSKDSSKHLALGTMNWHPLFYIWDFISHIQISLSLFSLALMVLFCIF